MIVSVLLMFFFVWLGNVTAELQLNHDPFWLILWGMIVNLGGLYFAVQEYREIIRQSREE